MSRIFIAAELGSHGDLLVARPFCGASKSGAEVVTVRPNILWILTTQWRAQACGFAGDSQARTPNLDALAAQGVNYTQAVTPHPFGPFARAALLTGLPSPANGVARYEDPLPTNARTIAHALRERGYATAFFGKWHLAPRDPAAALVGEAHARTVVPREAQGGFEFWEGFEGGFLLNDPWLHGTRFPAPVQMRGYQAEVLANCAQRWWHEHLADDRPWFCVVSLEPPHPPYDAEADGRPRPLPGDLRLAPNVPRQPAIEVRARSELSGYYAHIEATDGWIGRLLSQRREERNRHRTIVVFTSVHGDMHGAHGRFRKGWPYEESVRVPLLIGTLESPAGRVDDAAVSLLDLGAMTLAWAEGREAVRPAQHAAISMPAIVALPHQCDRLWRGVRTRRRKLVLNADGSPWLFFDLEADPWEMQNLVHDSTRAAEIPHLRQLIA